MIAHSLGVAANRRTDVRQWPNRKLGTLADAIADAGIASPSVIVVGDVIKGVAQAAAHPDTVRAA